MKHAPVTTTPRAVRRKPRDEVQLVEPAPLVHPFFSFHFSYTEVTTDGDRARVRNRRARFEDGKLSTEQFDGELPRAELDRVLQQAQQQVLEQTAQLVRAMTWFLPWGARKD